MEGMLFKAHAAVTEQLIEARCAVDLQEGKGATPLHIAARNGYATVTEQLIEARCNVHLLDKDAVTPIHIVASIWCCGRQRQRKQARQREV